MVALPCSSTQAAPPDTTARPGESPVGTLYVVGIGPGADLFTPRARAAARADVIVGYSLYVDLVRAWWPRATSVPARLVMRRRGRVRR
ncbi:MAG: SAM-dependent methyltransferase [Dehalococcoidia bacterium]